MVVLFSSYFWLSLLFPFCVLSKERCKRGSKREKHFSCCNVSGVFSWQSNTLRYDSWTNAFIFLNQQKLLWIIMKPSVHETHIFCSWSYNWLFLLMTIYSFPLPTCIWPTAPHKHSFYCHSYLIYTLDENPFQNNSAFTLDIHSGNREWKSLSCH